MRHSSSSGPPAFQSPSRSGSFLILLVRMVNDELRDVVAELEALDVIEAEVLSGEDAAEAGLGRHVAIAGEGADGARQRARDNLDLVAVAEVGGQHGRASCADGAVGAGIRRIGG